MRLTAGGLVFGVFLAAWPAPAPAADDQARAHFERAEAAFRARRFEEARLGYQAAYELQALPGLLFNIAQCHRQLGNPERAIFFYERYLDLAGRTANRARALELIAQQRTHLKRKRAIARAPIAPGTRAEAPAPTAPLPEIVAPPAPPETVALTSVDPIAPSIVPPPVPSPEDGLLPLTVLPVQAPPPMEIAAQRPLHRRWWFWTAAALVVAGGAAAAMLLRRDGRPPEGILGSIDRR